MFQPIRLPFQKITYTNALPSFSGPLKDALNERGEFSKTLLFAEIHSHIKSKTGGDYLSKKEWNILCSFVVNEYPVLADSGNPKGYVSGITLLGTDVASKSHLYMSTTQQLILLYLASFPE